MFRQLRGISIANIGPLLSKKKVFDFFTFFESMDEFRRKSDAAREIQSWWAVRLFSRQAVWVWMYAEGTAVWDGMQLHLPDEAERCSSSPTMTLRLATSSLT